MSQYYVTTTIQICLIKTNQFVTRQNEHMSEKIKLRTSRAKCAMHIMKNKIHRDLSPWLKLLEEVSGQHVVY